VDVVRFAILGLGAGAVYALTAQGLVLVYRGSGVLNFAQGAMGMVGAFVFYDLRDERGWSDPWAMVTALAVAGAIGALTHLLVMRPLRDSPRISRVIATLGILTILQAGATIEWSSVSRFVTSLLPVDVVEPVAGATVGVDRLYLVGIAAALTATLWAVYRLTLFGVATSAVAEDERALGLLGWSPDVLATVNWALGAMLGALAAILVAPISGLSVSTLSLLVVPALAAALVGNFTSFPLTLAGGLAIGIGESELARYVPSPGWSTSMPLLVIVVVLVVRGHALPLRGERSERPPLLGTGRVRALGVIAALVVTIVALADLDATWIDGVTITMLVGFVGLSLVVVTGYAGQISLAQFAMAGMGAWIAGRLVANYGIPFELALLIGVAGTVPIGLVIALPSLRVRGVNLAIVTMALALVLERLIFLNRDRTGKFEGTVVGSPSFFGIDVGSVAHPERYAILVALLFAAAGIAVANLRRGRAGRRLIAVRTNERAATALGVNVFTAKLFAFGVASAIAAAGGVLMAFRNPTVNFNVFNVFASINIVVYAVIGGIGFVVGPLVGASLAPGAILSRAVSASDDTLVLVAGLVLVAIVLVDPNGLVHRFGRIGALVRRRLVKPRSVSVAAPDDVGDFEARPAVLEISDLRVAFGGVIAVDGAALTVRPGSIVGLIGPNGAGKTTLVDAVTGFVRSTGSICLDGRRVDRWSAHRRARAGVARSFQTLELFDDMTVRENLWVASDRHSPWAYVTDVVRPGRQHLSAAAVAAVREFQLEADLDRKPDELPYGRRRLVAIARAIASQPSVLLLDEPAAGLDESESRELGRLLRRLADEWRLGILLIEHDVALVLDVCDEVVALDFGRPIAVGTPAAVRSDAAVIRAYLGEPDDLGGEDAGEPVRDDGRVPPPARPLVP
jgi:ABC-type branched-subunit amino acid transport system ATPase component/branched-subunit amino acid ABC-type transport system permease component